MCAEEEGTPPPVGSFKPMFWWPTAASPRSASSSPSHMHKALRRDFKGLFEVFELIITG